ncbi:DUF4232 domain-containing protein [Streptomyces sp. NPDC090057]|uniref:DUF4232 domain-containing protein n=1 Tax=Streptomyces sp. NPDC090057 TaxID=3365935 RepID=UPI0037FB02FD
MTTHRARRTARSAALAAVTAALALGLTACGGDGSKAAGTGHTATATATGAAQRHTTHNGNGQDSAAQSGGGAGEGARSARPATALGGTVEIANTSTGTNASTSMSATAGVRPCRGDAVLVTAVHRFAGQPGDHLLITASNEGSTPCWVTSYPAVKLDGDVGAAALPHSRKDAPGGDKHITLRPGGKAYSAVNLFDYGSKNHTARSFALALRGADGHAGPFYSVDTRGRQPRFSWNEADVLNWNTRKPYDF